MGCGGASAALGGPQSVTDALPTQRPNAAIGRYTGAAVRRHPSVRPSFRSPSVCTTFAAPSFIRPSSSNIFAFFISLCVPPPSSYACCIPVPPTAHAFHGCFAPAVAHGVLLVALPSSIHFVFPYMSFLSCCPVRPSVQRLFQQPSLAVAIYPSCVLSGRLSCSLSVCSPFLHVVLPSVGPSVGHSVL